MEQNHLKSDPVSRVPSEEEFAKLVKASNPSAIRIYLNLLAEGFTAYKKAVAGLEVDEYGGIISRGFFWVIVESLRVIVLRVAATVVASSMIVLTTALILLSPAISLIHLPFLLIDINRKQKAADAEGKATDAELREKVESAMRDAA